MSTANYKKNPHRVYYVKYCYLSEGVLKKGQGVVVNPIDEEDAIQKVTDGLTISGAPQFMAWVTGYKDW